MRKLDQVSKELLVFLQSKGDALDIEQQFTEFLRSLGIEEAVKKEHEPEVDLMQQQKRQTDSLQFAHTAYEQQLDKNKSFTKLLNEFNGCVNDAKRSLDKENSEKFSTDGSASRRS